MPDSQLLLRNLQRTLEIRKRLREPSSVLHDDRQIIKVAHQYDAILAELFLGDFYCGTYQRLGSIELA